jgi:hypothetical protein
MDQSLQLKPIARRNPVMIIAIFVELARRKACQTNPLGLVFQLRW